MSKKNNNKGFTLAELLIVVAIIAVLVAIAIPVFSSQLEKSREGVDAANIRSAYAEVMAARMGADVDYYKSVSPKQQKPGWVTANDWPDNLFADAALTKKYKEHIQEFKPTSAASIYVITAGEGKAYMSTAAAGASNVDELG